ncbi:MAG: DinB family protein [Bacteroidales bacterium]
MNALDILKSLFAHMAWADAATWRTVAASEAARGDKALRDRLYHLHLVQHAFLTVWQGVPLAPRTADSFDAPQLLQFAREYHGALARFLDSLDPARFDDPMPMPWANRAAERMGRPSAAATTIGETMIQVASHSTHHRGQVATHLRQLGVDPPLTDFIAWTWLGKPAPDWPAVPGK